MYKFLRWRRQKVGGGDDKGGAGGSGIWRRSLLNLEQEASEVDGAGGFNIWSDRLLWSVYHSKRDFWSGSLSCGHQK